MHQEWFIQVVNPATGEKRCFEVRTSMCDGESQGNLSRLLIEITLSLVAKE